MANRLMFMTLISFPVVQCGNGDQEKPVVEEQWTKWSDTFLFPMCEPSYISPWKKEGYQDVYSIFFNGIILNANYNFYSFPDENCEKIYTIWVGFWLRVTPNN